MNEHGVQVPTLRVAVQEEIAVVTLDNPPHNAYPAADELRNTLRQLNDNRLLRAAVLTGSGDRYFCTGASQDALAGDGGPIGGADRTDHRYTTILRSLEDLRDLEVPLIGAINGLALGGGLALAASCDFLISSRTAAFGLPEVPLSLLGGASHFGRLFPPSWTRYAHLTGNRLTAEEAFRLGAVIKVVEPNALLDSALEIARQIASYAPAATKMAKRTLTFIEDANLTVRDGYRYESTQTMLLNTYEDSAEARSAWADRRLGEYKLR